MDLDWRQSVLDAWQPDHAGLRAQWISHAQEVEALVADEVFPTTEGEAKAAPLADSGSWVPNDPAILRTAALLHDLGNSDHRDGSGIPGGTGHGPGRSAATAAEYLAAVHPWRSHGRAIERIRSLIDALPAARAVYPTVGFEGRELAVRDAFGETVAASDDDLLRKLREADSRAHLSPAGIAWLVDLAIAARIPVAPEIGSMGFTPSWGTSAIANIRLLAKCAIRHVRSEHGRRSLKTLYRSAETRVRELCAAACVTYAPELFDHSELNAAFEAGPPKRYSNATIQLVAAQSWDSFRTQIERVTLEHDSSVAVYPSAQIRLVRARIEGLRPTALYMLRDNLTRTREMHRLWLGAYGITPLDLAATVEWRVNGDIWPVSPPFLEPDPEHARRDGTQALSIVDGLHRINVAKELGLGEMTCVVIDGAAVPLPVKQVEWHLVQEVDATPSHSAKRAYRFETAKQLLELGLKFSVEVTDQNAPHLLYRNYRAFGSTGVRSSGSTTTD